ncbi:hypothetical protein D3C81_1358170 [compost metagenome]
MTIAQRLRQRLQTVSSEHELLQVQTFSQLNRQRFDAIVGENQPTQPRRQRSAGDMGNAVGLEADHCQFGALAEAGRQLGEAVIGTEQHAQSGQAVQVFRQRAQGIAAEVEHLERVRQRENFLWKFAQVFGQIQACDARQLAGAQLCKGVHEQVRY